MFEYIGVKFKNIKIPDFEIKRADYYVQDGILTIFKEKEEPWHQPKQRAYRKCEINIKMSEVLSIETSSKLIIEDKK